MERKSYCCMAAGSAPFHGVDADVATRLSQIMLRYRPIAPKPAAPGGSSSSSSSSPTATATTPRGRRRWGDGKERRRGRKKRVLPAVMAEYSEEEEDNAARPEPVTLPLMPESPESKEESYCYEGSPRVIGKAAILPDQWVVSAIQDGGQMMMVPAVPTAAAAVVVVVESTAEITGSYEGDMVGRWLCWCREEVARKGLEGDAWPAFVTDVCQRVSWTNPAFRRMAGWDGAGGGVRVDAGKMGVGQVLEASGLGMGFTCRVTVSRRGGAVGGKGTPLTTAPCDVWRLVDGCLAWRIDVGAALSLRR